MPLYTKHTKYTKSQIIQIYLTNYKVIFYWRRNVVCFFVNAKNDFCYSMKTATWQWPLRSICCKMAHYILGVNFCDGTVTQSRRYGCRHVTAMAVTWAPAVRETTGYQEKAGRKKKVGRRTEMIPRLHTTIFTILHKWLWSIIFLTIYICWRCEWVKYVYVQLKSLISVCGHFDGSGCSILVC